jgi:hypothetical protein
MAQRLGSRRPAVAASVRRAPAAGVAWPCPAPGAAGGLDRRRLPSSPARAPAPPLGPAGATGPQARTRQGVTWCLLWQAEQAATPDGLQSRGFGHTSRAWARTLADLPEEGF